MSPSNKELLSFQVHPDDRESYGEASVRDQKEELVRRVNEDRSTPLSSPGVPYNKSLPD